MLPSSRFRGEGPEASVGAGEYARRATGTLDLTKCIVLLRERRASPRVFQQGRHDEQLGDASALRADEGRGIAAISGGEPRAGVDPPISEWGNPTVLYRHRVFDAEGTGGTETSHVPRGTETIPVVAASEPGEA
jgi:hypothetical protein